MEFYNKINTICQEYNRVALFVDMDGTIAEYTIYPDGFITTKSKGLFLNSKPLNVVINNLKKVSEIPNLDIFILTLSKTNNIIEEKKEWLKKFVPFVNETNYIILSREKGEYNSESRAFIKGSKIKEKLDYYDYAILLDDDHKILRTTQENLKEKCKTFHVSSAII